MKKEQPLNLYRLILASIVGLVLCLLNEKVKANFQRKIGSMTETNLDERCI